MKTIQFNKAGIALDVLHYAAYEKPTYSNEEVLVKVMARPINPSDYMFIEGQYRTKPQLPQIAGLEGSGIISAVGQSVIGLKKGDHVAFRGVGSWAEYITLKPESLIAVNRDMPFEQSAQLALNPVTAFALLELARLKPKGFLCISSATSALSAVIIQLAAQKGIQVIGLVRDIQHKEALLGLGAIAVLDQNDPELQANIMTITGEIGIAGFLDAVGGPLLSKIIRLMKPNGIIIVYGRLDPAPADFFNGEIIYRNLSIIGFGITQWLAEQTPIRKEEVFNLLINSIADKKLLLPETELYKLKDFRQAIEADKKKRTGKIVLINNTL